MRILLLITGMGRGGAETQVCELAQAFRRCGHEVIIVSLMKVSEVWKPLVSHSIPILSLGMIRGRPTVAGFIRTLILCLVWRPDVLHSHMYHANLLGRAVAAILQSVRVVGTAHSVNEGAVVRMWLYRFTDALSVLITNVSRAGVQRYVASGAISPKRAAFVPNGIVSEGRARRISRIRSDFRMDLGSRTDVFVWVCVGRLEEVKNHKLAIQAFSEVVQRNSNCELLIVGDGSLRDDILRQVQCLQLDGCVRILGMRSDVAEIMKAADAFVMSSLWEGLPMALLEAAAAGLPLVATDVGGNSEVLSGAEGNRLVPSGCASAMSRAILDIMTLSIEERNQIGDKNRQYVERHFGMASVASSWCRVYSHVASLNKTVFPIL